MLSTLPGIPRLRRSDRRRATLQLRSPSVISAGCRRQGLAFAKATARLALPPYSFYAVAIVTGRAELLSGHGRTRAGNSNGLTLTATLRLVGKRKVAPYQVRD
jgi:hypothetical protein